MQRAPSHLTVDPNVTEVFNQSGSQEQLQMCLRGLFDELRAGFLVCSSAPIDGILQVSGYRLSFTCKGSLPGHRVLDKLCVDRGFCCRRVLRSKKLHLYSVTLENHADLVARTQGRARSLCHKCLIHYLPILRRSSRTEVLRHHGCFNSVPRHRNAGQGPLA